MEFKKIYKFFPFFSEKRKVTTNEIIVDNKAKANLPKSEEAWLRGLTDGHDEWKKVQEQEKALFMAKKGYQLELAKRRKLLVEQNAEIDVIANKIHVQSERINTDIPKAELLYTPPKSGDLKLS